MWTDTCSDFSDGQGSVKSLQCFQWKRTFSAKILHRSRERKCAQLRVNTIHQSEKIMIIKSDVRNILASDHSLLYNCCGLIQQLKSDMFILWKSWKAKSFLDLGEPFHPFIPIWNPFSPEPSEVSVFSSREPLAVNLHHDQHQQFDFNKNQQAASSTLPEAQGFSWTSPNIIPATHHGHLWYLWKSNSTITVQIDK